VADLDRRRVQAVLADARANKVKSKISILARSAEPLHDFVAGADASPGESCPTKTAFCFYRD